MKTFPYRLSYAFLLTSTVALHAADGANALASSSSSTEEMWSHIDRAEDLGELRNMTAQWDANAPDGVLTLVAERRASYAWAVIPAPKKGWNLARRANVVAEVTNRGTVPAAVLLWVVGDRGWDAVVDSATLASGESRKLSCDLRTTFPDGTPKLDPGQVKQVQVMLRGSKEGVTLEVRGLAAAGDVPQWQRPSGRMDVPVIEDVPPAPGRRVRYRLDGDEDTGIYSVLHLPVDWKPGDTFPVIVEYPGNIFFTPACYSTGLPDQCVIGYGITKGKGAICVCLPFVDRKTGTITENSWGNADDTADYAVSMVNEICAKFGGDRKNVLLTGFSRGALACGYIGLRNERIASLWKGFHACQHYDGDGWHGATMESALERAKRFKGKAVFHTDNSTEKFQPLMDVMKTGTTYVRSGLGAHACAMFLDDRPSTQQLRKWFADLIR
jgi:hypothetical protein